MANQTSNEISYTGYGRVAVARSSGGWTITGTNPAQAANTAAVTFGACTGGSATATYFSVGRDSSGAGEILWKGTLTASLAISNGITPQFAIGALACTLSVDAAADILALIFQNTTWANLGDVTGVRGSSTAGNLYIALHSSDPG